MRLEIHGSLRPVRLLLRLSFLSGNSHFPRAPLLGFHNGLQPPFLGGPRPLNSSGLLKDWFWHRVCVSSWMVPGPPAGKPDASSMSVDGEDQRETHLVYILTDRWREAQKTVWDGEVGRHGCERRPSEIIPHQQDSEWQNLCIGRDPGSL